MLVPTAPSAAPTPQQPVQQPVPVNPDAPKQPLVDDRGNATTDHGAFTDLVSTFDNYVNSGGDITKLTKQQLDTVQDAVTAIPNYDNKTSSPAVMYTLYKQGKKYNAAVDPGRAIRETLGGIGGAIAGETAAILTDPMAAAGNALSGAWAGFASGLYDIISPGWNTSADLVAMLHGDLSMKYTFGEFNARRLSGMVQGTEQSANAAREIFGPGSRDVLNAINIANQQAAEKDPDKAAQLDLRQSEILRGQALRNQQYAQNLINVRDQTAANFKAVGLGDFANKITTVQPDPISQFVGSQATDPVNLATFGGEAGIGAAAQFFKAGVRADRLAEATAAVAKAENNLTATTTAKTNLYNILTSGVPMSDTTRAGWQSNVARLNVVEKNLVAARDTAGTEYSAALADVNKQLTTAANANPFRQAIGGLTQVAGGGVDLAGKALDYVENIPRAVAEKFFPNYPDEVKDAVARAISGFTVHMIAGPYAGAAAALGPKAVGTALKYLTADALQSAGKTLGIIGEQYALGTQTLPYWRNVANKLEGIPAAIASKLDNQVVYSIPSAVTGGITGGAIGGTVGMLGGGGDPEKFKQGLLGGAVLGTAGGGLGQITRFRDLATLRQAAIGDRSRFIGSLSGPNKTQFLNLPPDYQLAISVYGMAHPDAEFRFFSDPTRVNGSWTPNNPKSTIDINVAGDNPLHAIAAHEVGHHVAAHGLQNFVNDTIIGNPVTGTTGIMNKLDEHGQPLTELDPVTDQRRFVQNEYFENYKGAYNARLRRDNPAAPMATDQDVAQEMFADLHAQYMHDPETLQKTIRGYVPSDLVSQNVTANWLAKMGMGADPVTGNPLPTSTLQNARSLGNVVDNYYRQTQAKRGDVDVSRGTDTKVNTSALKGTPEFDMLQTQFDASGDFHRNPDGTIMTDAGGRPLVKTVAQADRDAAKLGNAVADIYRSQPHLEGVEGDNLLKVVTDRDGRQFRRGQRVPEAVFQELEKSNQFNANQLLNWRKADGVMQRNDGSAMMAVYNTASKRGGRYATLAAREREFVPIWTEISLKTDQVNIKGYDPEQLTNNLAKGLRSRMGQDLYAGKGATQLGPALADARTYLENLANDRPGETGIGLQKKAFLNRMFGFAADANPMAGDLGKLPQGVVKSFRLDRLNRIREVPGADIPPFHEKTYGQLQSFFQPRGAEPVAAGARFQPRAAEPTAPDETAIPVTYRTTSTGKTIEQKIDYGIANAPLVASKQPGALTKDSPNNFGQIGFLGKLDQQRLTHLDKASAVGSYANKLVQEFGRWKDNPDVMAAKDWYRHVRGYLETTFGDDAEKFANLLAATSPQQGVVENWHDALEAYRRYKSGAYDDAIAKFKDTGKITEDMKPTKANGAKFGMNSDAVLRVLADTWMSTVKGPKTPNFNDNLFGRGIEATIDKWAARTMRRLGYENVKGAPAQWRLTPPSETGVSNLDFALSQQAFRRAASRLGMDPHELQAIMWYAEKHHWAEKGWAKGGAAAAKASYVPMLKSLSESVAGGMPMMEAITAAGKGARVQ